MELHGRAAIEQAINDLLLQQWDPLGVRDVPGHQRDYDVYAHQVFGLLARGASELQITRFLHGAEGSELNHPELASRDLAPLVRALRAVPFEL